MKPKLFPNRFNLLLDAAERGALEDLFDLDPHLVDENELLHKALRAGIEKLNQAASAQRKDPDRPPNRTEVAARTRSASREGSQVELYLGFPISEELRQKFQDYLDAHPKIAEEDAAAFLLDQGLFRDREMMARFDDTVMPSADLLNDARVAARHRRCTRLSKLRTIVGGRR